MKTVIEVLVRGKWVEVFTCCIYENGRCNYTLRDGKSGTARGDKWRKRTLKPKKQLVDYGVAHGGTD